MRRSIYVPELLLLMLTKTKSIKIIFVTWNKVNWKKILKGWLTVFSPNSQPCCIVNKGVVYIAYQFEPQWDSEDISEEDRAEPVQARLLMVCLMLLSHTFRYAVIMLLLMLAFNIRFYSD